MYIRNRRHVRQLQSIDDAEALVGPSSRTQYSLRKSRFAVENAKSDSINPKENVFNLPEKLFENNGSNKLKKLLMKQMEEVIANAKCLICLEMDKKLNKDGITCSEGHFLCWDCVSNFTETSKAADVISGFVNEAGRLVCPDPQCKQNCNIYDQQLLCSTAPKEIFMSTLDLLVQINTRKAVKEAVREEQKRHKIELDHIQQLDEMQREVYFLRLKIINEILNPQCPRCQFAYIDFEGCFALTCGNDSCKAAFCAWCEADCGSDAHPHVLQCPHSITKQYHGTLIELHAVRNGIRKEKIANLLATIKPDVRTKLLDDMQKEFADLGLAII